MVSDEPPKGHVYEGEIMDDLPASTETRRLDMPAEVPWGLGFLGEAKFEAIRRVIEARERALRAIQSHIHAEADVDEALVRRAKARDKLTNVAGEIAAEREVAEEQALTARLSRQLEQLKLQEQIELVQARTQRARGGPEPKPEGPDKYKSFVDSLGKLPGIFAAARAAKEDIIKKAGGETNLSPEDQDILSSIDQMLQEFIAEHGEGGRHA